MRNAIIKRWQELKAKLNLPTTFAEALQLAVNQAKEIKVLEEQAKLDSPKIEFAMSFRNMEGACSIGDFAKTIGTGRNRFFQKLREDGVLMKNNRPYQKFCERNLFVVVEQMPYTDSKGKTHPSFTTMITGKG